MSFTTNEVAEPDPIRLRRVGLGMYNTNIVLYTWGERRVMNYPIRFVLQRECHIAQEGTNRWDLPLDGIRVGELEIPHRFWPKLGATVHWLDNSLNQEIWGKFVYREIVPMGKILWVNSFSDKDAGVTRHPFSPKWPLQLLSEATFAERDGKTTVTIKWVPLDATDEERETFDGGRASMTQGWSGTLDRLTDHVAKP